MVLFGPTGKKIEPFYAVFGSFMYFLFSPTKNPLKLHTPFIIQGEYCEHDPWTDKGHSTENMGWNIK